MTRPFTVAAFLPHGYRFHHANNHIASPIMAQAETEQLTRIILGAALSRAVCTIAELGLADQIEAGSPRSVASLASATGTHEPSLYRILRFLASHGIFKEKDNRQFDHTPLS